MSLRVNFIKGNIVVHDGLVEDWAAQALFNNSINLTGWTTVEIRTNPIIDDSFQSYSAGYIEGYFSSEVIYNSWRNMQEGFCKWHGEMFCKSLEKYLRANIDWMQEQIHTYAQTVPYWHQVNMVLGQMIGLYDGYNKASNKTLTQLDLVLMNLSGDLEDLVSALTPAERMKTLAENVKEGKRFANGRCSALIKVLNKNADLLVSHVTWTSYQSMLKMLKRYTLPYHHTPYAKTIIPGYDASFSSYPTYMGSGDDFTLLSSGLLTLETTTGNSNPELWKNVRPVGQVQEWIRTIVANRLATSAKEWADIFQKYNSGTYNNQWMVVDYKKFKPGKPIQSDTLWIIEQLPGFIKAEDQSNILHDQSYWPSYNTPFYPEIYNLSGLPAFVERYGDWFTYDKTPRALMFKRDHSKVVDIKSLVKLMRYNDFKNDPLSKCDCMPPYSAENAISARNDLNAKNGSYPFAALGHRSHGSTDVKATSFKLFQDLKFLAISGPTNEQQANFVWSEQDFANDTPHYMHPNVWNFPLLEVDWYL